MLKFYSRRNVWLPYPMIPVVVILAFAAVFFTNFSFPKDWLLKNLLILILSGFAALVYSFFGFKMAFNKRPIFIIDDDTLTVRGLKFYPFLTSYDGWHFRWTIWRIQFSDISEIYIGPIRSRSHPKGLPLAAKGSLFPRRYIWVQTLGDNTSLYFPDITAIKEYPGLVQALKIRLGYRLVIDCKLKLPQ